MQLYIHAAFSGPKRWLDENLDVAAAFCASVLKGGKVLSADFDLYYTAVQEVMSKPPKKETMHEVFDMISEYDFWSLKKGIEPEAVNFMAGVAKNSGLLEKLPDVKDVIDERPYKMALELLKWP